MTDSNHIHESLQSYFTEKLLTHGANFKGVDWNSSDRQSLCFKQLLKICKDPITSEIDKNFSIVDYGCGYGALVDYLISQNYHFSTYTGFEITPAMLEEGVKLFGDNPSCQFTSDRNRVEEADYTIASGLLSLKLNHDQNSWEDYILNLLHELWLLSKKGLAVNSLTQYSDPDRMRNDLYYPDPCFLFDYCKTHFSKNVALLHDYGLYEFTILVRRLS